MGEQDKPPVPFGGERLREPQGEPANEQVLQVPIERIMLNPEQPRKHFASQPLEDLTASVRAKGILQPLLVRPRGSKYQIVAGERRYRAALAAGLSEVPVIVRTFDERETLQVGLIENLQRENLNALEEAETFKRLIDDFGFTQEGLAKAVGKDRTTISNTVRLLKLPRLVQLAVREGRLSSGHARALLGIPDQDRLLELARACEEKGWSVRQLEKVVQDEKGGRERRWKASKPTYVQSVETELMELLLTEVSIKERGNKGSIVIDYHSIDEFQRLFDLLKRGAGQAFEQVVRLKAT